MASTSTPSSPGTTSSVTSAPRPGLGEHPAPVQPILEYPAGLLAAAYPRMATAGLAGAEASMYGSASAAYAAAAAQSYLPTALSADPSVLYSSLAVRCVINSYLA